MYESNSRIHALVHVIALAHSPTGSHPLLAQVPLTVSPFISLPSAVTLPYTYKSVPSSLPPSVTVDPSATEKAKYVISSSGHAAHPDDIIASCNALQEHIKRSTEDAQRAIKDWEDGIKERDLAEKRRVAPGWLDREEKILEPTKIAKHEDTVDDLLDSVDEGASASQIPEDREGEELDRAFGGLSTK